MYSGFMSNIKPKDRQGSSNRCQRPTVGAVLQLLFTLSDYHADYFSYYTHCFKTMNCVSGQYSLWKSACMICRGSTEAANHHSTGAEAANHP
jgi:hypothetical protein